MNQNQNNNKPKGTIKNMKKDITKKLIRTQKKTNIYITKNKEVLPWKYFNSNMAVSIEYNLDY